MHEPIYLLHTSAFTLLERLYATMLYFRPVCGRFQCVTLCPLNLCHTLCSRKHSPVSRHNSPPSNSPKNSTYLYSPVFLASLCGAHVTSLFRQRHVIPGSISCTISNIRPSRTVLLKIPFFMNGRPYLRLISSVGCARFTRAPFRYHLCVLTKCINSCNSSSFGTNASCPWGDHALCTCLGVTWVWVSSLVSFIFR